jgi:hypothetical protein
MLQPYTLGFNTTVVDGGNILTNTVRSQSLYSGSVDAYKINTSHLAARSITTTLLAVGPQYQFRTTLGGQEMTMNQDGSLSLPSSNLNPNDNRWVLDATRSYPSATLVKTFAATFHNPNSVPYGILFNIAQGSAFSTTGSTGILVWVVSGTVTVFRVAGVGSWVAIGSYAAPTTGVDRLMIQYYGAQGSPRMRVYLNGTEINPGYFTDALLGTSGGAQGGCAGFLLTDSSLRISEIVMGNQTVTLEDGRVQAQHVDAVSIGASSVIISNIVGGINAGSTTINGGKITTNTIVADHIQVATLNASSAWLDALDARVIKTRTLVSDKIEARAMNFINNFTMTGTVVNWINPGSITTITRNGSVIRAMMVQTSDGIHTISDAFDVDANKSYTFKLSALTGAEANGGSLYFGIYFYDKDGATIGGFPLTGSPGSYAWGSADSNPYFCVGPASYGDGGRWLDMTGVVMAADTPANLSSPLPTPGNDPYFIVNGTPATSHPGGTPVYKMPPNCIQMRIRFLNYYNSGTTRTIYFHNPSVTEMGTGQISADMIRAGALVSAGDGSTGAYATATVVNDGTASIAYTPPVGFKISHTPFSVRLRPGLNKDINTTYPTSRLVNVQAEFGNNLSVGGYLIGDITARTMNALAAPPPGSTEWVNNTARVFYRGSIDAGTLGGAPNISKFYVQSAYQQSDNASFMLNFFLRPTSYQDNFDAMRYAKVEFYRGNASAASYIMTAYVTLPDRLYYNSSSDSDAGNVAAVSMYFENDTISGILSSDDPRWFLKITIYNVYGPSATVWFAPPASLNTDWTQSTSVPFTTGGTSGGGGGGGGGGTGCLPAGTPILVYADGQVVLRAVDTLREGDWAVGFDENTLESVVSKITRTFTYENRDLYRVITSAASLTCSHDHRLALVSEEGVTYPPARDLKSGDKIYWLNPKTFRIEPVTVISSQPTGESTTVYHMTMEKGHVYIGANFPAHNIKAQAPLTT